MSDEELVKRLRKLADDMEKHAAPDWDEHEDVASAANCIEYLSKKLKLLEKVELYLKTSYPEGSGFYFICGEGGTKDGNGLPERLHVCPAYGAAWMMLYTRTDKTSGPEY
jgi:hypothetical protein